MSQNPLVLLGSLMASRTGIINPAKFPEEVFDLYSISAFDSGRPELTMGRQIGSPKQVVLPGDVLLSRIVPHIRRCWIVGPSRGNRLIASGEWIIFRTSSVDTAYLRHVLMGDPFHLQFMNTVAGVGGSLLRARPNFVAKITIPSPSISEQQRIAQILDGVEALRAKRRETITLLDNLAQAIFLDMFGDPVSNPRCWPMCRLSQLGSLDRGVSKHRPRNSPELLGGKYPLVQTGDVAASQGYIEKWKSTYSDAGLAQSRLWPSGTLCITIAANIAKTGILRFDACFPDSVVGFSSDPDTVEYVRVWLSFLQQNLERLAPESAQKNINLAILRELRIPNPGPDLISVFTERIRAENTLKTALRSHLAELDALFASIQHRAFRGELWDAPAA